MAVIQVRPKLALLFDRGDFNDQIITMTRSSVARRWNPNGILEEVAIDKPRLDYDPVTGRLKGLLVEESSTNRIPYSEDFTRADWIKINSTVSANASLAPDGTTTADKLVVNNSAGAGVFQEALGTLPAQTYCVEFFAKADEFDTCYFRYSNSQEIRIDFDLSAKTATKNVAGSTFNHDFIDIEEKANGWFKCIVVFTTSASRPFDYRIGTTNTGNGSDGIYFWGASLKDGNMPSSYIKTNGSSATRSADDVLISGQAFQDFYNQNEGTLLIEAESNFNSVGGAGLFNISDGTANNSVRVFFDSPDKISFRNVKSGTSIVSTDIYTGLSSGTKKLTFRYKNDEASFVLDGGSVVTEASFEAITPTQLNIGGVLSGFNYLNGHIKRILFYPKSLTDAECILLTKTLSL